MNTTPKRALDNITVLDLSRVLAGPWCTQMMSDFGADVIKIERAESGDDTRSWGPPFLDLPSGDRVAAYFCSANRGKKSIVLDMSKPEDLAEILKLASKVDVLVENFKTGSLTRYGLDYESLQKVNPRLVYCSITGYGSSGPYAERPGYDGVIQGVGGIMSVTGERDDLPGGGPQKVGVALTDIMTGVYAGFGIMTALWERERSGEGQKIELALLDVQITSMATLAASYFASGVVPVRQGNAHSSVVPSDIFQCRDGFMLLTVGNDGQFAKLCGAINRKNLSDDPRYSTNEARVKNRDTLIAILQEYFSSRNRHELTDILSKAGVPAGPVNNLQEALDDPQVRHSKLIVDFPRKLGDSLRVLGTPLKLSRTPAQYLSPPPSLGQHSHEFINFEHQNLTNVKAQR